MTDCPKCECMLNEEVRIFEAWGKEYEMLFCESCGDWHSKRFLVVDLSPFEDFINGLEIED